MKNSFLMSPLRYTDGRVSEQSNTVLDWDPGTRLARENNSWPFHGSLPLPKGS